MQQEPDEQGVASAMMRTGSRAGAIGQLCIAIIALAVLSGSPWGPLNVAILFWRQEAMIATAFALFWLACARESARRRQAVAFLAANAFGWGVSLLLPIMN